MVVDGIVIEMNSPGSSCWRICAAPSSLAIAGVLDLRLLQVEVDRVQPVGRDHLLVGGGGGRGRAADLAQLGAVVAARGDDHVAAVGAHLVDDRADLRVRRHRVGAVPGRRAAAVGQDEGHLEGLLPGGRHDLPRSGAAGVQRAVVGRRLVPVSRQRRGGGHARRPVARRPRTVLAGSLRQCDDSGNREQLGADRRDRDMRPGPPPPAPAPSRLARGLPALARNPGSLLRLSWIAASDWLVKSLGEINKELWQTQSRP